MTTNQSKAKAVKEALANLGFDWPELNFVQRDSISTGDPVRIHITDRTPVFVDPDVGSGDGVREQCFESQGVDVGGKTTSVENGKCTWKLSNFSYEPGDLNVSEPAAFVATARVAIPVFLTSKTLDSAIPVWERVNDVYERTPTRERFC